MNYLQRKRYALMQNKRFHGYLRTATGNPLTIADCMRNGLVSLDVYGNSVQDGTPTPDAPVEIQAVGDITANISRASDTIVNRGNATITISSDNNCTVVGTYNSEAGTAFGTIDTVDGKIYTICIYQISGNGAVLQYGAWDSTDSTVAINTSIRKFVDNKCCYRLTGNGHKIGIMLNRGLSASTEINADFNFAIFDGDYTIETMPNFEPYGKYKIPVVQSGTNLFDLSNEPYKFSIYTDEPLYSIGGVSDKITIDYRNRTAELTRCINTVIVDGKSNAWKVYAANANYKCMLFRNQSGVKNDVIDGRVAIAAMSSHCKGMTAYVLANLNNSDCIAGNNGYTYIRVLTDEIPWSTVGTWTADERAGYINMVNDYFTELYNAGNPIKIYYIAGKYVTTDISDQIDWDTIRQTHRGTVKITVGTTIQPSNMTAQYYSEVEGQ